MKTFPGLRLVLPLAVAIATTTGCGSGGADEPAAAGTSFAATPAAVVTTDTGAYRIEVHSAPDAEPTRGVNALRLVVTRTSDGAPASDLGLDLVPFMPAMGHGASVKPTIVAGDDPGTYMVRNVYFFMPGLWELRATIAASDHATARFDVQ